MCGRFSITVDAGTLFSRFSIVRGPTELPPRYNLAPTQLAPVIDSSRTLSLKRWGLIPSWAKDATIGTKMINARSETVAEKPSFRGLLKQNRCLLPADGFYEWLLDGGTKVPYRFVRKDGAPFAFAGLWTSWQDLDTFTILTTGANSLVRSIHDRMPVILLPENEAAWLEGGEIEEGDFFRAYPEEFMELFPVNRVVNSVKNDTPECMEPVV